MANLAYLLLFR